jgi:hypothetical protein
MPKIVREGSSCPLCDIPYRIGDDQRLYLTLDGIQGAHENCFVSRVWRSICRDCEGSLAYGAVCACGCAQAVLEEVRNG